MPRPAGRRCGSEPRAGARFCDTCGSPIIGVETQSEHKQVTVLFADVQRSMDLAAALGPERLSEVMGELFNRDPSLNVTAVRSSNSPETASWLCSGLRSRWKI